MSLIHSLADFYKLPKVPRFVDGNPETLFHACREGDVELVRLFLERGEPSATFVSNPLKDSIRKFPVTPMMFLESVRTGHIKIVKILWRAREYQVRSCLDQAIQIASNQGHTNMIRVLNRYRRQSTYIESLGRYFRNDQIEEVLSYI